MEGTIRAARPDDLEHLRRIEVAAGEAFRAVGMDLIADDAPPTTEELAGFQADGRAWVAVDSAGCPVAYLLVSIVDGDAHIDQVSVHPDHAHRRLGRDLIEAATGWARDRGLAALSLTTFAEVPWNAPYYERLGFVVLTGDEVSEGLLAICEREAAIGLDRWPRVAMRRAIP